MDSSEQTQARPRHRRSLYLWAFGAVVVVVTGAALAYFLVIDKDAAGTGAFDLKGSIMVRPHNGGPNCSGISGYDDIRQDAQVTVTDGTGKVVGLGRLGPGSEAIISADVSACQFSFTVTGVPSGAGFYGVEVGKRGTVRFAEPEAKTGGVKLSIGKFTN